MSITTWKFLVSLAKIGAEFLPPRVVNLSQLVPDLTCDTFAKHMRSAFSQVYGLPATDISLSRADLSVIETSAKQLVSWQWLYGPKLPFSFACEDRFQWGSIRLELQVASGVVQAAQVYTDSMDWQLSDRLQQALTGCKFNQQDLMAAVSPISTDIAQLLKNQEL